MIRVMALGSGSGSTYTCTVFVPVSILPNEGIETFIVPVVFAVTVKVLVFPVPDIIPLVTLPVPSVMVMWLASTLPGFSVKVKVNAVVEVLGEPLAVTV